jgi:rubrerythrin
MASSKKTTYVDMNQFMDLAIQFEVESAEFYARMRKTATEESVRKLLATLEAQENDHARTLKEYEAPKDGNIILQFAPELSLSMPVPKENPDFGEMLSVAIERERASAEIYRRVSERRLGAFKDLLEGLAVVEQEHERKLKRLQGPRTG